MTRARPPLLLAAAAVLLPLWLLTADAPVGVVLYGVTAALPAAAVAAVTLRRRPDGRVAWSLVAAALLTLAVGHVQSEWALATTGSRPDVSVADLFCLATYVLLGVGAAVLFRLRRMGGDPLAWLDGATVALAVVLVVGVLVVQPALAGSAPPGLRALWLAYVVGDGLMLGILAVLTASAGARPVAYWYLVAGAGLLLAAHVCELGLRAAGLHDALHRWTAAAWLVSALLVGVGVSHPSVGRLAEPVTGPGRFTAWRAAGLAGAVLVGPVLEAAELVVGVDADQPLLKLGTVALVGLALTRTFAAVVAAERAGRARAALQEDLAHQAAHDHLTGLANRARTMERAEGALHRARRAGTLVGLLFVDLDRFKQVNDTYGHAAGDAVLATTAERMRRAVRAGDTVGRVGGDELVVVLEALESEAVLLEVAQRVLEAVVAPVPVEGRKVTVGASIGVALSRDGAVDADRLVQEADLAALRAKDGGRGGIEVFDEALRRALAQRTDLEDAIRRGLAAGEFRMAYQPVVDLATGAVASHEALARWDRPGHGPVPPDVFIRAAEESALVCDIGRWGLREVARQLADWSRTGVVPPRGVAVNISGRHLMAASVVEDVTRALDEAGVDPALLTLEITETVLVDHPVAHEHLRRLRDLGVAISIDDFGTGYTSIGQLQHLPASTLKLDRSLVAPSGEPASRALVELVVHAAHAFGLRVVAEGVETEEQLGTLREIGCDLAQGYLLARPQAPETAARVAVRSATRG